MTQILTPARPDVRPLLWAAPLAGLLSGLVNAALFLATARWFDGVTAGPQNMSFAPVMFVAASLFGAIGAGVVYALLTRFVRQPNRVFFVVSTVALLLSMITPLSVAGGLGVQLVLAVAHVVVYGFVLWLVPRRAA